MNETIKEFFERPEHQEYFKPPIIRAIFLEGVLVRKLLITQRMEKQSEPFYARLNGLKITEKVAKRILPEVINKLTEYGKYYKNYQEIVHDIGTAFIPANFNLSDDEYSFAFTLGMALERDFRVGKEKAELDQADVDATVEDKDL